jgi:hypothetical protein
MEVHVFVSLAHVVNRHIEYPTIITVQGETRESVGRVQYLAHVSLAIQNEVERKRVCRETSQNRGYSICGLMSNPHGINLGIEFLIIEVTEQKGERGEGCERYLKTQWGTVDCGDCRVREKGEKKSIAQKAPCGQAGQVWGNFSSADRGNSGPKPSRSK